MTQRQCVKCGSAYERAAGLTFDQGQCDPCIEAWARERAAQHADAAITAGPIPDRGKLAGAMRMRKIWGGKG